MIHGLFSYIAHISCVFACRARGNGTVNRPQTSRVCSREISLLLPALESIVASARVERRAALDWSTSEKRSGRNVQDKTATGPRGNLDAAAWADRIRTGARAIVPASTLPRIVRSGPSRFSPGAAVVDARRSMENPDQPSDEQKPKDRLVNLLDHIEAHVEQLRKDAARLMEEKDGLLTTLDTLRNNDMLFTLEEREWAISFTVPWLTESSMIFRPSRNWDAK